MSKTDYEEYLDVQVDALIKKLEMFKIYERKSHLIKWDIDIINVK